MREWMNIQYVQINGTAREDTTWNFKALSLSAQCIQEMQNGDKETQNDYKVMQNNYKVMQNDYKEMQNNYKETQNNNKVMQSDLKGT